MNDFQEYFDMLMALGECRKYYRNAQDLYVARYPDRQKKSHMAFKRIADRFCRFGTCSRQMEEKSGISQRSVLRILHQHKFHPYRMSLHQDLYGNNFLKRFNFCNWIRKQMRTDVSFLSHVLFADKANFANTGNVNRHNMHEHVDATRWCTTPLCAVFKTNDE